MKSELVVVEDSDIDFDLLRITLKALHFELPLRRLRSVDEAMDWLRTPTGTPALMLLDLNLNSRDGREVLLALRKDTRLGSLPVVVLTTSSNPHDVETSYRAGANGYMVKSVDYERFENHMRIFVDYWFRGTCLLASR